MDGTEKKKLSRQSSGPNLKSTGMFPSQKRRKKECFFKRLRPGKKERKVVF
jgi:hypothetical protein